MSYLFDDGSSMYLDGVASVTDYPCSISAWIKTDDLTANQGIVSIVDASVPDEWLAALHYRGADSDQIRASSRTTGTQNNAVTSTAIADTNWHHAAGTWDSTNGVSAFLDGGGEGTSTTVAAQDIDAWAIGRQHDSTPGNYFSGNIAEVGIWNIELTAAEIAWLATGASPLTLLHRLPNLVLYRDLIRELNRPYIGGTLTNNNAATVAPHSRALYPHSQSLVAVTIPAVGGIGIPIAAFHYNHHLRSMT